MANTLAQSPTINSVDPNTTISKTFAGACTNPSLIVAVLTIEGVISGLTVSDGVNGGNYTQDAHGSIDAVPLPPIRHCYIFSKANTSTSALTVTASWTGSASAVLKIFELTNAGGAITLNTQNGGGGDNTAETLSITTTAANATVIAGQGTYPNNISANTNYTLIGPDVAGSTYHASEYRVDAGSAGGVTLTFNNGTPVLWAMAIAAYALAGAPTLAVTITTPTSSATYNNGTTSTITLGGTATLATSVTWSNDRGGSGSATNTGTSYSTWSISSISLSLGANVITVTAGDGSTTVTDTITVTYTATPENCRGFGSTLGAGTTDKITSALTANSTQRSWAFWANRHGAGGSGQGIIFEKASSELFFSEVALSKYHFGRIWNTNFYYWSIDMPSVDAWHHVVVTYDAALAANVPLIYLDGISQTVTVGSQPPSGSADTNTNAYSMGNGAANTNVWDGMLSEFAIWNRILSGAEAAGLATLAGGYNGKSPLYYPTSLVEYVPLNDSPVTSKVLANPTVTGTAQQTGLAIDYPAFAALTATFTDSLAGGELL